MSSLQIPALAPHLRGEKVELVQLDSRFFAEVFRAVNNPETMALTATSKTFTRDQIADWLDTRPRTKDRLDWAILHQGEYAGEIVLNELRPEKNSMNLRIALADSRFFSKGLGSEALGLVVDYAFDSMVLDKITLEVLVDNLRAIGAYKKIGFVAGREFSEGKLRFLRMSLSKFDRILALSEGLMARHLDVTKWRFAWDNAKRRAGLCNYRDRVISISTYHAQVHPIDETLQVVLHEIAHALCGKEAGHTKVWLATAKSIGYRAERFTGKEIAENFAPWVGYCPAGHEHYRYRKPTRQLSCALCSKAFSKANLIEWQSR